MRLRAFGGPHRYIQGPHALSELKELAALYGRRPFIVADAVVTDLLGSRLRAALDGAGEPVFATFGGECTAEEIDALSAEARQAGADMVIGVGGGKAIDTAKGVRIALDKPLIVVPTIASNDSPTSRLVVVYRPDHVLSEVRLMPTNPDAVLVDTEVIVKAPPRFLAAGIGDALSKKFEVEQCAAVGGSNFYKGAPTRLALGIADTCYGIIRAQGIDAMESARRQRTSDALEDTVEATTLLSGLAFESGGLSIAHSLTRGFSAVPAIARALHGEQVALGLLVQLVLEGRPAEFIDDLRDFCRRIGLPTSLASFGIDDPAAVDEIAEVSWRTAPYIRNIARPITQEDVRLALLACLSEPGD